MLELCGCDYVVDHCVATINAKNKDEAYKSYIADCLKGIAHSVGCKITRRYYDIVHPAPVDKRSVEEQVNDIAAKAGIKVVKTSS